MKHIEALFKNFPLIVYSFDSLIHDDRLLDEVKNKFLGHYRKLTNPEFITKLYLIREVTLEISKKEKEAPSETFNPFDSVRIINDF